MFLFSICDLFCVGNVVEMLIAVGDQRKIHDACRIPKNVWGCLDVFSILTQKVHGQNIKYIRRFECILILFLVDFGK